MVSELSAGREPVLAQSLDGDDTRAAVLDKGGKILAGDFYDSGMFRGAKKLIGEMLPGQPIVVLSKDKRKFLLERQSAENHLGFWKEALAGQEEAWGAWLLTMTISSGMELKVVRHILAAQAPWTTPALPEGASEWSLTPLNAGLGRLIVFGDDDVALETAALGGRIGLKVTLVTIKARNSDAKSFQNVGTFKIESIEKWKDLTGESFPDLGIKTGVFVLVTVKDNHTFLSDLEEVQLGWFGLAGDAAPPGSNPGVFPAAQSPAQKALGIITEMLGNG
jgi:hypothetical protein